MRQLLKRNTALRRLTYLARMVRARGQSDETQILHQLSAGAPKTFVEFGFHPVEFNCSALSRNPEWSGLLIDGNAQQVADARALLPKRIDIVEQFLTLDNVEIVKRRFSRI